MQEIIFHRIFTEYSRNILERFYDIFLRISRGIFYGIFLYNFIGIFLEYSAKYSAEHFLNNNSGIFNEYVKNIPWSILYKSGIFFYSTEYNDYICGIRGIFFGICLEYIFWWNIFFKKKIFFENSVIILELFWNKKIFHGIFLEYGIFHGIFS